MTDLQPLELVQRRVSEMMGENMGGTFEIWPGSPIDKISRWHLAELAKREKMLKKMHFIRFICP